MEELDMHFEEENISKKPVGKWRSLKFKWKENISVLIYISGTPEDIKKFMEDYNLDYDDEAKRTLKVTLDRKV